MSDTDTELSSLVDDVKRHLAWQREEASRSVPIALGGTASWLWTERPVAATPAPAQSVAAPTPRASPSLREMVRQGAVASEGSTQPVAAAPRAPAASSPKAQAPTGDWEPVAVPAATSTPIVRKALDEVRIDLGDCRRCRLCETRKQIVFGVGNPKADLVFVGEGPGAEEDNQGIPFVGNAGQLLTKMIEAMGFSRDEVYICNVVKCRPPGNRNPEPDEIEACEPFLKAQLASIQPKVIIALGKFAAQTLLRDPTAISRLRGQWREYEGIPLMPTFHPSYLLRSPDEKKLAWADLKQVMARFGKPKA